MSTSIDSVLLPHVKAAIERLSDELSYAGCNDYTIPNTLANRDLWDDYQTHVLRVRTPEAARDHADYYAPELMKDGQIMVDDGLMLFALRRACGLI